MPVTRFTQIVEHSTDKFAPGSLAVPGAYFRNPSPVAQVGGSQSVGLSDEFGRLFIMCEFSEMGGPDVAGG